MAFILVLLIRFPISKECTRGAIRRCAKLQTMPYPEPLIKPMREDLTRFGVQETRTPEELDEVIRNTKGTVMIVVNSVCGCAAGLARPAIGMALKHAAKPDRVVTVFAGADIAATERAR